MKGTYSNHSILRLIFKKVTRWHFSKPPRQALWHIKCFCRLGVVSNDDHVMLSKVFLQNLRIKVNDGIDVLVTLAKAKSEGGRMWSSKTIPYMWPPCFSDLHFKDKEKPTSIPRIRIHVTAFKLRRCNHKHERESPDEGVQLR